MIRLAVLPPFLVLALLAALAVSAAAPQTGFAAQGRAITVAANDGYGLQECLGESGECGQAIADAWCEAEGLGPAVSFGRAANAAAGAQAAAYVVSCRD